MPFLHRVEYGFELYFLFLGLYPKDLDLQYYCDTVWVLEQLGIRISNMRIIHLNADYVRGETLDVQKLFVISDTFYNSKNHPGKPLEETIRSNISDPTDLMAEMDRARELPIPDPVRSSSCSGRQMCRYLERCFLADREVPDNHISTLVGGTERFAMAEEGRQYLREADVSRLEGSPMQYAQVMADRNGGLFADRASLNGWMEDVTYPITFLDFEWERFAIPPYQGMRPFDVLLFEYSIHILAADGTITHTLFLSVHDDRRELAEQLIRDIPEEGTVIAYNAEGAEKLRINELIAQFPEYTAQLKSMNDRMKDLQIPFTSGFVYDVRMRGGWTLKRLMSMMDDPGYQDLDIRQGMDAVFRWRELDRDTEGIDREQIINELKAYCGMDSYATLVVFQWLQSILNESFS